MTSNSSPTSDKNGDSRRRNRAIITVTLVGMIGNIALAAFKIFAGIVGRSHAVLADGVHSISDLATDLAIIIGSQFWSRPADISHPHGHRRIETIISLSIGLALITVGLGIGYESVKVLRGGELGTPGKIALYAALASIVLKEAMYRWTVIVGKKEKSPAVVANAWHHRSDALSSIPAAITVGAATISPSLAFLDPVGGIIVTLFILYAAGKILWPVVRELADAGAPPEMLEKIGAIVLSHPKARGVHHIRTRYLGSQIAVDLHLVLDDNLPLITAHEIGDEVADALRNQEPDIVDVIVHLDPLSEESREESTTW